MKRKKTVKSLCGVLGATLIAGSTFSNPIYVPAAVNIAPSSNELTAQNAGINVQSMNYRNNIGALEYEGGDATWEETEKGLLSNAVGKGDCFAFSKTEGKNFVYSTKVKFVQNRGAAALLFRSNNNLDKKESYVVNIDASNHKCKFFRWQRNDVLQLIDEKDVKATEDEEYELKVVAYDSWILYYVNDELIASSGDYVLQPGDNGQDTYIEDGYFGLLNWESEVIFQDTYYAKLDENKCPFLKNIKITSDEGKVDKAARFDAKEPMMLQYVNSEVDKVNINVEKLNDDSEVEFKDEDGNTYEDGKGIPVKEGKNYITVKNTIKSDDGMEASVVYRINVHKFKQDVEYYNEVFRDQYHYSVKEGWANDPNGLVKFNGTYHMFYQFFDDIKWGPMHWAHATSKDLIHWEEEPIAFYPDANGAMFSGCIVADENNTSGLFKDGKGGLVALITADGNGQRIKVAYSEDEGKTWKKLDKVAADWTKDPLNSQDFRDPKVFRWNNEWLMVVAGGPLRIYSSENLLDWKCESTYKDLHTECPDLYPIKASDENLKWVLSRGGRLYKVGDLKKVGEKWSFVPDEEYKDRDGIMNFGRDSYAAMTYYVQDFGTEENPTIPDIVELNWMNTWDDYCNSVAEKTGQDFNGTFNLNLKLGLNKEGESYVLTQKPIDEYEKLRDESAVVDEKNITIEEGKNVLDGFEGDTYEIVAHFKPEASTKKVGFKVRKGEKEETIVGYDLEANKLYIDRSNSGIILTNKFKEVCSQDMKTNKDGSIDLHIYVDRASVEAFSGDYTVCGAAQIFANPYSLGAEAFAEGGSADADITIYKLDSIWDKEVSDKPYAVGSTSSSKCALNCGESVKLNAFILPLSADQDIEWKLEKGDDKVKLEDNGKVTALDKGSAVIVASSKSHPELKKVFTINVYRNNFKTNVEKFVNLNGNWTVDDETLFVSNSGQNDMYMTKEKISGDYEWTTNIKFTKGLINLFAIAKQQNPFDDGGAVSIQFAPDNKDVRLFKFGGDDIVRGQLKETIGDGKYHKVKVTKEDRKITLFVDDEKCLEHELEDNLAPSEGYVGLGLWDGELEVQDFYVKAPAAETPSEEPEEKPSNEKPSNEKPSEEKPSEEKPSEEKPSEEKPSEEKPSEEKPSEEKPSEEKPSEEKPSEEKPSEEKPSEEKPSEEKPSEEKPSEEDPSKEDPSEDDSEKNAPSENKPSESKPIVNPELPGSEAGSKVSAGNGSTSTADQIASPKDTTSLTSAQSGAVTINASAKKLRLIGDKGSFKVVSGKGVKVAKNGKLTIKKKTSGSCVITYTVDGKSVTKNITIETPSLKTVHSEQLNDTVVVLDGTEISTAVWTTNKPKSAKLSVSPDGRHVVVKSSKRGKVKVSAEINRKKYSITINL